MKCCTTPSVCLELRAVIIREGRMPRWLLGRATILVLIVAKCCVEYVARRVYLVPHERLRMCAAVKAYYIANTMHKAIA